MLRASMRSTGNLWMRQVFVQSLTRKFEDAATLHGPKTVVATADQGLTVDDQPASGLLSYDTEDAAERISQLTWNNFESKASNMQLDRKKKKQISTQLGLFHA